MDDNKSKEWEQMAARRFRSGIRSLVDTLPEEEFKTWLRESKQGTEEDPQNPQHWFSYGVALASLDQEEEAIQAFQRVVALAPRHVRGWYWLGMVQNALGHNSEALEAFERTTDLSPEWPRAWCDKGVVLAKQEQFESAAKAFEVSLSFDGEDPFTWGSKGCMLREMNRLDEALVAFTKATELDTQSARAWDSKGDVLRALGRLDEAFYCFERATQLEPRYADGWRDLGYTLLLQEKYKECLMPLDKALSLGYFGPEPYVFKSYALMELGDLNGALTVCDEGLTTWRVRNLFRMRTGLLKELNQYDEVIDTLDRAIREGIADDEMRIWKGVALIELKRFDAALGEFNDVLRRSEENVQARCGRAYCLCKIGKPNEGTREIEQVVENNAMDARSWYTRSHIYAALADTEKMLTSLEKAIQLEPELADEAPTEEEFGPYKDLSEFQAVVGK